MASSDLLRDKTEQITNIPTNIIFLNFVLINTEFKYYWSFEKLLETLGKVAHLINEYLEDILRKSRFNLLFDL